MWERRTKGKESGLLPTPLATLATNGGPNQRDSSGRPGLQMAAMMWPTPNCPNGGRSVKHVTDWRGKSAYHKGKKAQVGLEAAVKMWPTPRASAAGPDFAKMDRSKTGISLATAVELFPAPTVCGNYNRKGASKNSGDGLATFVKTYPTPTRSMCTIQDFEQARYHSSKRPPYQECYPTSTSNDSRGGGRNSPGTLNLCMKIKNETGGQLNPTWVEWLMGWPLGWTDLKPLVMGRFRNVQQRLSAV